MSINISQRLLFNKEELSRFLEKIVSPSRISNKDVFVKNVFSNGTYKISFTTDDLKPHLAPPKGELIKFLFTLISVDQVIMEVDEKKTGDSKTNLLSWELLSKIQKEFYEHFIIQSITLKREINTDIKRFDFNKLVSLLNCGFDSSKKSVKTDFTQFSAYTDNMSVCMGIRVTIEDNRRFKLTKNVWEAEIKDQYLEIRDVVGQVKSMKFDFILEFKDSVAVKDLMLSEKELKEAFCFN